jgi:heat shock protein HtpX
VGAALIKAMISRSREFVADADGARIAGSPEGLMSALAKLDAMSRRVPLDQPNPAMNNMFIIEPLASNVGGGRTLVTMFATHPPTEKRIASLKRLRTG